MPTLKSIALKAGFALALLIGVICTYGVIYVVRNSMPPLIAVGSIDVRESRFGSEDRGEFTDILRKRFPVGTRESIVIATLEKQRFEAVKENNACAPLTDYMRAHANRNYILCPFFNPKKSLFYNQLDLPCRNHWGVGWETDEQSRIVQIDGYVWHDCTFI